MEKDYSDNVQLVKNLIKAKEDAYVFIVDMYHRELFAYALSLTNNHSMSQDIVQAVFVRTWEFRNKLKPEYSIKGFLIKSVYNEFVNQYHRNQKMMPWEKIYADSLYETIEDSKGDRLAKLIAQVGIEIDKLPPRCKEAFLLNKKEGLTQMEISVYMNISVKSVEAHISKAYSILRKRIGHKMDLYLFLLIQAFPGPFPRRDYFL